MIEGAAVVVIAGQRRRGAHPIPVVIVGAVMEGAHIVVRFPAFLAHRNIEALIADADVALGNAALVAVGVGAGRVIGIGIVLTTVD